MDSETKETSGKGQAAAIKEVTRGAPNKRVLEEEKDQNEGVNNQDFCEPPPAVVTPSITQYPSMFLAGNTSLGPANVCGDIVVVRDATLKEVQHAEKTSPAHSHAGGWFRRSLNSEASMKDKAFSKPYVVPPPHLLADKVVVIAGNTAEPSLSEQHSAVVDNGGIKERMTEGDFDAESAAEGVSLRYEAIGEGIYTHTGDPPRETRRTDTSIAYTGDPTKVITDTTIIGVAAPRDTLKAAVDNGGTKAKMMDSSSFEVEADSPIPHQQQHVDNRNDETPKDQGKCSRNVEKADNLGGLMNLAFDPTEEMPEDLHPSSMIPRCHVGCGSEQNASEIKTAPSDKPVSDMESNRQTSMSNESTKELDEIHEKEHCIAREEASTFNTLHNSDKTKRTTETEDLARVASALPRDYIAGIDSFLAGGVIVTAGSTTVPSVSNHSAGLDNGYRNKNMTEGAYAAEADADSMEEGPSRHPAINEGILAKRADPTKVFTDAIADAVPVRDMQKAAAQISPRQVPDILDTRAKEFATQQDTTLLEERYFVSAAERVGKGKGWTDMPVLRHDENKNNKVSTKDEGKCHEDDEQADSLDGWMDLDFDFDPTAEMLEDLRPSPMIRECHAGGGSQQNASKIKSAPSDKPVLDFESNRQISVSNESFKELNEVEEKEHFIAREDIKFGIEHHPGTMKWTTVTKDLAIIASANSQTIAPNFDGQLHSILAMLQGRIFFQAVSQEGDEGIKWLLASQLEIEEKTKAIWDVASYEERVSKLEVNSRLEVKFLDETDFEEKYYVGTVRKCCGNGVFRILYDDSDEEKVNLFERVFRLLSADLHTPESVRYARARRRTTIMHEKMIAIEENKPEKESEDESVEETGILLAPSSEVEEGVDVESEMVQPTDRDVAFGRGADIGIKQNCRKVLYITNSGKEKFLSAVQIIVHEDKQTNLHSKARRANFNVLKRNRILDKLPGSKFYRCLKGGVWQEAKERDIGDRCKSEYLQEVSRVKKSSMEQQEEGDTTAWKQRYEPREPCHGEKVDVVERSDRDVCFGDAHHPGTVAWRAAVKKGLSENRYASLGCTKALLSYIATELSSSGPRQFLVRSKTDPNRWETASDEDVSRRTTRKYRSWKHQESKRRVPSSKYASIRIPRVRESSRAVVGSTIKSARAKRNASKCLRGDSVKLRQGKRAKVKQTNTIKKKDRRTSEHKLAGPPLAAEGMDTQEIILGMIEDCNKVIGASDRAPRDGNLILRAAAVEQTRDLLKALQNVPWAHAMNLTASDKQVDRFKRYGAGVVADCLVQIEPEFLSIFLNELKNTLGTAGNESNITGPPLATEGIETRAMILSVIEDCNKVIEASDRASKDGGLILLAAVAEQMKGLLEALQNVPWAYVMNERTSDRQADKIKRHGAGAVADLLAHIEPKYMPMFLNGLKNTLGDVPTQQGVS